MFNGSYAQRDITESERGNDVSNPTGGEWSLVAPTAKLYQRYLKAWLDPDAHTRHNRDNSCISCQDDDTDAVFAAAAAADADATTTTTTTTTEEGFISSHENYVQAWEKLSEREEKQRHQKQQHQQQQQQH